MHVVSEIQRRPNKARLKSEKYIVHFYSLCTLVQLVCLIVFVTQFDMASNRTFTSSLWVENPFELAPSLVWLSKRCSHSVQNERVFAFTGVSVNISDKVVGVMFAALATEMHATFFLAVTALLVGAINRYAVKANFFEFKWRNFNVRKDCFFATEIVLISALLHSVLLAEDTHRMLHDYLDHCNTRSRGFLPYCSTVPMIIFITFAFATYFFGFLVYMWNALPKYGIMSDEEVVEYREWLRRREESVAEVKRMEEEVRRANTRLQLMLENEKNMKLGKSTYQSRRPTIRREAYGSKQGDDAQQWGT
ncbi:hypothetical protein, conserved [Trypanosoma brucei gambiense DAL972]|uniref:Uncharacterized protein n=2 Tax=Trypanosoma brucei TaxID=5691 RepID=C9ZIN3_TRYB9|nr:hypothetical protein, conserved [Trypanosoma brucei gambiense DAL972]RHW74431.1 hypothetical protein DPX39_010032900 [Trypanosoma brucei equiperdum]CBH09025.1 hypothetical protein, conserved [Trypanosoma brucei gambiense DAL972]|eukprot:XP_011771466.1 hypothetical protein, conserved [Trypanosoma brucei gambiense DAL972]